MDAGGHSMTKIELTEEQCKNLTPLWNAAVKEGMGWVILAQVHPNAGFMAVNFIPKKYAAKIADVLREWDGEIKQDEKEWYAAMDEVQP